MALIDKASLLMVPSVYEDGTLYNVLPSGNKAPDETGNHNGYDQTRADFTFSRGSNLAATRVNSDGLIEKGRENLLLQSNEFTSWNGSSGATLTPNQPGYDGTNDAWLVTDLGYTYQTTSVTGVNTYSIYAKAGTGEGIRLRADQSGSDANGYFNLSTGEIYLFATGSDGIDANIESVGDGWYRCSITWNANSMLNVRFYVTDGAQGGTAGDTIYIQDAQLEAGLVATPYIETGATTATAGVLENTPRIDYSSGAGALLLEPQRTNKTEHAEYFEGWSRVNTGVAILDANAYTSPEGLQNAYKVTLTEGGGQSQIYKVLSGFTIGTKYTQSLYVKYISGSGENFQIVKSFGTAGVRCTFTNGGADLSVIAVGGTQANDFGKEPLGNGWFRIWFTYASNTTNWEINISRNSGTGSDVYAIYGHQIEEGSHVSSYVPTYGSAATRGADSCSVTGVSDVIGQTEGTIFWEGIAQPNDNPILVQLIPSAAGNYTNTIYLEYVHSSTEFKVQAWDTGVKQVQINTGAVTAGQVYKLAFAYKSNDFALYMNGTQIGTDTSGSVQSGLDKIGVGSLNGTTNAAFYGSEAKQVALFNERLSNTELAALTA